jgi:protein SCO1
MLYQSIKRARQGHGLAIFLIAIVASGIFVAAGCNNKTANDSPRFHLKGKVVTVNPAEKTITVDHEAIPGFMGAMEMPYPAGDVRDLGRVGPGDKITADIVVEQGVPILENIVVTKKAANENGPAKP